MTWIKVRLQYHAGRGFGVAHIFRKRYTSQNNHPMVMFNCSNVAYLFDSEKNGPYNDQAWLPVVVDPPTSFIKGQVCQTCWRSWAGGLQSKVL